MSMEWEDPAGPNAVVYVLDDDDRFVRSVEALLASTGLEIRAFADPADLVSAFEPERPSCLILDLRLCRESGLEVMRRLRAQGVFLPVVMVAADANVPTAVKAMKSGACDFIEKPFEAGRMLATIGEALGRFDQWREMRLYRLRNATLTAREEAVLRLIVQGRQNKGIAEDLGISPKTVEVHRARVMAKMHADCVASLVRMQMVLRLGEAGSAR